MPRSIAGSSLSRYASTDFESQPDPAFEGINTDEISPEQIIEETMKLIQEKTKIEKEIQIFDKYCDTFGIPGNPLAMTHVSWVMIHDSFLDIPVAPVETEKLSSRKKKRQNTEKKMEKLNLKQKIEIIKKLIDNLEKSKVCLAQSHQNEMEKFDDDTEQFNEQYKGTLV